MKNKHTTNEGLVFVKNDDVFTDSKIIAIGTETSHETIQKRIKKYKNEFEQLGKVRFEIRPSKKNQKENI